MTESEMIFALKEKQGEIKVLQAQMAVKDDEFKKLLANLLRKKGVPESFNLVDVIEAFAPSSKIIT